MLRSFFAVNAAVLLLSDFSLESSFPAPPIYPSFGSPKLKIVEFDASSQAVLTLPSSVNNLGVIVGSYWTNDDVSHGFVRNVDGTVETFDVVGAGTHAEMGTVPSSINNKGTIVGYYIDDLGYDHGFFRSASGKITKFEVPGSKSTSAYSINGDGVVVGRYATPAESGRLTKGFVRESNGVFIKFGINGTANPIGVNSKGVIAGSFFGNKGAKQEGFVRTNNGILSRYHVGSYGTFPTSISSSGAITGSFIYKLIDDKTSTEQKGYARTADGDVDKFEVAFDTNPASINKSGMITGSFNSRDGMYHGFLRASNGDITKFDPPGSKWTTPASINDAGEITGSYLNSSGREVGFLFSPE